MSSFKTDNKKLHPGFVLIGENGLPVDTVSTISGTYPIIQDVSDSVMYNAGVVTVPVGVDLSVLKSHQPRYTGRFVFQDASQRLYFIDKLTINPISRTFVINPIEDVNSIAPSINLSAGWFIAEASLMNKLSTTTSAKIDQVEFRDMQFNMSLEGEKIVIKGTNGNTLEPTPNGGVNITGTVQADIDFTETNSKLANIDAELEQANATLDEIVASSQSIDNKLTDANTALDNISSTLSSPLQIQNPVVAAGTQDGLANSTPFVFVNNIKNQILAAHDRDQELVYEDFGTKNQRITQIIYTSPTFPAVQAVKTISYSLVGNRYRRDTITWSIE